MRESEGRAPKKREREGSEERVPKKREREGREGRVPKKRLRGRSEEKDQRLEKENEEKNNRRRSVKGIKKISTITEEERGQVEGTGREEE